MTVAPTAEEYIQDHWFPKKIWTHLGAPKHQDRFRRITSYLPGGGTSYIDVGCACGHSTDIMAGMRPGQWRGVDFSHAAIVAAQANFSQHIFHYLQEPSDLPSLGTYDGVVCSEVIEHVEDDRGLLRALWSITANTLVITTPSKRVSDPGHLRLYNNDMLISLAEDALKLSGVQRTVQTMRHHPFWFLIARRL